MVVTTERDWGGWRVPGAEYDLDPYRVERQAEVIVRAPIFMKLLEEFVEHADQEPENLSDDLTKLAQIARRIISEVSAVTPSATISSDLASRAPRSKSDAKG